MVISRQCGLCVNHMKYANKSVTSTVYSQTTILSRIQIISYMIIATIYHITLIRKVIAPVSFTYESVLDPALMY